MALISMAEARAQLRVEDEYPDDQIAPKLAAAELIASRYIERRIFESPAALAAARDGVPAALAAAGSTFKAAVEAAEAMEDLVAKQLIIEGACSVYREAQTDARMIYAGVAIDDQLRAGILMILGHLFENRSDVEVGVSVAEVPMSSRDVLSPYRPLGV